MNAHDLFHGGRLAEAIAAQVDEVKGHPAETDRRIFLAELLCFAGDLERADTQLDAVGHQAPRALPWVAEFRQLIRAEQARRDFFASGRVPEFLGRPEGTTRLLLEASIRVREGATAEARVLIEQAEAERPRLSGTHGDRPFDDFRDLDDLTSAVFEVLSSKGQYFWIPADRVELLEPQAPARPRDLLWRPARLVVRDGPDGEVFLPALYPGAEAAADDAIRLGRATEWRGDGDDPVRGVGQKTFLVGEEDVPLLELKALAFGEPEGS